MKQLVRVTLVGLLASTYMSFGAGDGDKNSTPENPNPTDSPPAEAPANPQPAAPAVAPTAPAGPETPAPAPAPAPAPEPAKDPAPATEPAPTAPAPAPAPAPTDPNQNTETKPAAPETTPAAPQNGNEQAQTAPAPAPAAAPGAPTETPAGPDGTEVVPLIVIDDVPLTDAIRNLARQSGLNFQFDPRVTAPALGPDGRPMPTPNVSFRWENVSAHDALVAVLDNYNLQLVRDPQSRISRITIKDPKAEEPLISKIVQLRYAEPTNIVSLLKPNLSARSQVLSDSRTAQLIVSTTAREWETVSNIVSRLDLPTKQVLIESRMLETAKNPTAIRGIDWANTFEAQHFTFGNDPAGSGNIAADTAKAFNPSTAFLNASGVNAVLSWLNKEADTEVVATPRAVTMDNQPATLQVTKAYPIIKVTPGSANSPAGAEITYTNIGVILQVTPRITANNYISLKVVPEVSNIDSKDSQQQEGKEFTANIYAVRRADTHVMIPSGHTLVMGGLISDNTSTTMSKVPLLGDAPALGGLFRHKKNVRNKQNLIIFITPTVVEDEAFAVNDRGQQFLRTKYEDTPEVPDTIWDSARPADWSKPNPGTVKNK